MQCIVTALGIESENFISFYQLSRVKEFKFPVYQNCDMVLVQTGIGKDNIESRLKSISALLNNFERCQFINIGIAGGNPDLVNIGDCLIINKISSDNSVETYYPDILVDHKMKEASIITVREPVTQGSKEYPELVDMEASEIFRVCKELVPIHRMAFIKIVSDYMVQDQNLSKKNFIMELIYSNLNEISKFLEKFNKLNFFEKSILDKRDIKWISNFVSKWKLTETQKFQLENVLKFIRTGKSHDSFPEIPDEVPKNKFQRNKLFNQFCEKYST